VSTRSLIFQRPCKIDIGMTDPDNKEKTLAKLREEIAVLVQRYSDLAFESEEFVPGISDVPVSGKVIGGSEVNNMVEASLDGWLTTGRLTNSSRKNLQNLLAYDFLSP